MPKRAETQVQKVYIDTIFSRAPKSSNKRVHFCLYCEKPYKTIQQHFKIKHSSEKTKKEVLVLKTLADKDILRNKGDHFHNRKVLENNYGELVLPAFPQKKIGSTSNIYFDVSFTVWINPSRLSIFLNK